MKKKKRKYEDKLYIDMPFEEAVERFAGVDPQEMRVNIAKSKKKKPPGDKKPAPPSGPPDKANRDTQNVVRLRDRRKRNDVA